MSATHAYFLVDAGALADCEALLRVVTRMLVYLASKHDTFTWNYEVADLRMQQRALTAQGKRRICERRQLGSESLQDFGRALDGRRRRQKAGQSCVLRTQRAALDTLHQRLMCLEADVEWGDPALMRSPTRASAVGRAWTDPTRLNESMSVRSHLYIVGESPGTPAEADAFVYGLRPGRAGEDHPLLETLTRLRDGIIGDGIWESYARKRVGVSWISPSKKPRLCDMDPAEILVDAVFGGCVEALGGCVMSVPSLDCEQWLPFSVLYTPLHRTRTHPGWSRKLSRELSAVVDCFSAPSVQPRPPLQDGHADTEPTRRSWSIRLGGVGIAADTPDAVLVEADGSNRRWLMDGRLLRRYDLPEMVALAGEAKAANMCCAVRSEDGAPQLECVHRWPLSSWPRVVRALSSEPVICHMVGDGDLLRCGFIVARQPRCADAHNDGRADYAAVVPAGTLAALYLVSADEYSHMSAVLGLSPKEGTATEDVAPEASSSAAKLFSASWLEGWVYQMEHAPLDISPVDHCALDVGIEDTLICDYASAAIVAEEPLNDALASEATTGTSSGSEGSPNGTPAKPTPDTAAGGDEVSTLEEWYTELYLKAVAQPQPQLGRSATMLALLLDGSVDDSGGCALVEQVIGSVLQSSADIEGVFEATACDEAEGAFAMQRRRCAARVADDADCRRRWQLHECQLQILVHLLAADHIRKWDAEDDGGRVERLAESLYDLVDQLCIWASVDDGIRSFVGNASSSSAAPGGSHEDLDSASDFAAAFIGSSAVSRFSERLGEIVDELRVQCGWVPPGAGAADAAQSADGGLLTESKRRKGTPRKLSVGTGERSEVIVGQGKRRTQAISGRRLARHLEELIGGAKGRQRHRSADPPENPAARSSSSGSNGEQASLRRQSVQLKLPPHLVRQLKNEVVVTARPAPLARSHTISGRGTSTQSGGLGKRAASAFGTSRGSTASAFGSARGSAACGSAQLRMPRRKPIPEFSDPRSSPSLSGRVKEMHLVPGTPATKRQRTAGPVPAGFSPTTFTQTPLPAASTFIYDSDDSEDGGFERSPVFSRVGPRGAPLVREPGNDTGASCFGGYPAARRALRFPGEEDG
ncbi:hypothetical protein LPJ61_000326 [Coemansia biformis]|uniref:DNA replication regulator Sld3 C-terminal domain-containing protein n=1 Tax=Coemansia biformis TaxID=1286918 RepID=A0A9W7YGE0_9FUNG|nr:hypothetical protein LPJ61_000326 [Coemansia biformis]